MDSEIEKLLAKCWGLMEDHEPDGWPAIQMREVTALCDEIRRLTPRFRVGEKVKVLAFSGEYEGEVVSRSEHKTIGDQYAVYAKYPHSKRAQAEWFPEDQIYDLQGDDYERA